MPSKRPRDEDTGPKGDSDGNHRNKKAKHGFRVGPDNLPDGPWRRKVTKIKKNLIVKAKVKKQYAKVKAEFKQQHPEPSGLPIPAEELEPPININPKDPDDNGEDVPPNETSPPQVHPDRQALLDDDTPQKPPSTAKPPRSTSAAGEAEVKATTVEPDGEEHSRRSNKQHHSRRNRPDYYAKQLAAAEKERAEVEAKAAEKARRIAERERYRKAMAKAKRPGKDGKPKLGRESGLLLERVKRMVGQS